MVKVRMLMGRGARGSQSLLAGMLVSLLLAAPAHAAFPGQNGKIAVMQAFRARLVDSGTNGALGDADDRIFATQGIYTP